MITVLLAFDEKDSLLGQYFQLCAERAAQSVASSHPNNMIRIGSQILNSAFLTIKLNEVDNRFIFLAYSHGSPRELQGGEGRYLSVDDDLTKFKDSFFYTFSCDTAQDLAGVLLSKGCNSFIGYKSKVYIVTTYQEIFANCSNFGLLCFLKGNNISDSFNGMKQNITNQIDGIYATNYLVASVLRSNRESLTLHANDHSIDVNYYYKNRIESY